MLAHKHTHDHYKMEFSEPSLLGTLQCLQVRCVGFQMQDNCPLFICFFCVTFIFLLMVILMMSISYFWMVLMESLAYLSQTEYNLISDFWVSV